MTNDVVDRVSNGISKSTTLVIASIVAFVSSFRMAAVNVALPTIGSELGTEAVLLAWVTNTVVLASAVFMLPVGRLADIYGRKKFLLCGILLSTVSSFLCANAGSTTQLIAFRVLQGIAGGMTAGTSVAILTSVFPIEERGRALGIHIASLYLGLSLAPFLGGVLTQHLGWRCIFYFGALLGLISTVLVIWRLKGEWAEARGDKFDIIGSVIFGISLLALMYGFTVLLTTLGIVLILVGASGMVVFVWYETRTASPILNVGILRKNTVFILSNIATLVNYCATFAITFLMSLYLQYIKGLSPLTAGLLLIVRPVAMSIVAPFAGRLSDRFEPRKIAAIGMAFACTALIILVFLNGETAPGVVICGLVIFGVGTGLFSSPNTNAVMSSVENKYYGVASGTMATMRSCGQTLSMSIVMILFSINIGESQITPEYYPAFLISMKAGFIIFAALCFGGMFAQLIGGRGSESVDIDLVGE